MTMPHGIIGYGENLQSMQPLKQSKRQLPQQNISVHQINFLERKKILKFKINENYVILSMISSYFYIVMTGNYDLNAMKDAIISRFNSSQFYSLDKKKIVVLIEIKIARAIANNFIRNFRKWHPNRIRLEPDQE